MGMENGQSDDKQSSNSLDIAVGGGVNFFDTAAGGRGHYERLLGDLVKRHSNKKLYLASKVPPKILNGPQKHIPILIVIQLSILIIM